jgi:cytochrome c oxidase cbb3-type subunit 3
MSQRLLAYVVSTAMLWSGCDRERRPFDDLGAAAGRPRSATETPHQAGPIAPDPQVSNPYLGNAWAIGEGKRLFTYYNCTGCHAHGGGAIGPPLMDDEWIYGYQPHDVYRSIVDGRPNGMPAYGGKVPEYQVWQLAAYVDSMSGQVPIDAAPGRSDQMQATPAEMLRPFQGRRQTGHK